MSLQQGPYGYNRFQNLDDLYLAEKVYWTKQLQEKKAAKDYDGDGKVESGKEEYFGSRDKAIKKAMGKEVKEGKDMPDFIKDKMKEKHDDAHKDDKKEGKKEKCECKEDVTAEHVVDYLMENGYVNNEVSAEVFINNMSDAWLNQVIDACVED